MSFSVPPVGNPKVDYAIPIKSRTSRTRKTSLASVLRETLSVLVFATGAICINSTQFLLLPLKFFPPTRAVYADGLRYTKASAAILFSEFVSSHMRCERSADRDWVRCHACSGHDPVLCAYFHSSHL